MKSFLKVLLVVIILIVLALFIIPVFFQDEIAARLKEEANKQFDAQIEFSDVNLSLIRAFPDFSLEVEDLSIAGRNEFAGDTLVSMESFFVTVDLFSVFKGEVYILERISLTNPEIKLRVLKNAKVNWDIVASDETTRPEEPEVDTSGGVKLQLDKVSVSSGKFAYLAEDINTTVKMNGINLAVNGDFTAGITTLETKAEIRKFTLGYEGINYLDEAELELDTDFKADLNKYKFSFEKGEFALNDLELLVDGYFMLMEQGYDMDIAFKAEENEFRSFLSLVPAIYTEDFKSIQTDGELSFNGFVKGSYSAERIPGFELNIDVKDGEFRYPDLSAGVSDVNIKARVKNNGYDMDNTVVDVSKFDLKMAENPFSAKIFVKTPVSDPFVDASLKGVLNLTTLKNIYPFSADMALSGTINADISIEARMSAVEDEKYDQIKALGYFHAKEIQYQSLEFPEGLRIPAAQMNISPQYLDLVNLDFKYGRSSFNAHGKINDYLAYSMGEGMLEGNLEIQSPYFNVDEFLPESMDTSPQTETDDEAVADTIAAEQGVFRVPHRIDFLFTSQFDKLAYDNIIIDAVNGTIKVAGQKVILQGLEGNIAGGKIKMEGTYDTHKVAKPEVSMNLDIESLDFTKAYNTFAFVEKFAPIAQKVKGTFTTGFNFKTHLGNDMMPLYETLNGGGKLQTSPLKVANVNTLEKIAGALKMDRLKSFDLNRTNLSFTFENGRLNVKPFNVQMGSIKSTVQGWTSFDQTINYVLDFTLPKGSFGKEATNILNDLAQKSLGQGVKIGNASSVNVKVMVDGTTSDPEISTSLKGTGKKIKKQVKEKVEEEIEEKKVELKEEAGKKVEEILKEADEKAERVLKQAQNQAENIKKEARRQAQKLRNEADRLAQKITDEAKGKGMLKELAAKKAAEKVRDEADKKAEKLVDEAESRADKIVEDAEKQAETVREEARKKTGGG